MISPELAKLIIKVNDLELEANAARREATELAHSIWRSEFSKVTPDFELCDSTVGIISQIDNMYAGVRNQRDTALAQNAELVAQVEALRREFQDARRTLQIIASCGADSTDAEIVDVVLDESRRWVSRYDDSVLKLSASQHLRDVRAEAGRNKSPYC